MVKPIISVVIPTHNRRNLLCKTIDCLCKQDIDTSDFEIILVDDASTDRTRETIEAIKKTVRIKYIYNDANRGRAISRNLGIKAALGEYILMLDDDIWASTSLVSSHLENHKREKGKIAVLGAIRASDKIPKTLVNLYLNNHHEWCYHQMIEKSEDLPSNFCKTANISIKRSTIKKIGLFNEGFRYYGGEDTELGCRMRTYGIRMVFNEKALGYHFHNENIETLTLKYREYAKSMIYIAMLQPHYVESQYNGFFTPYYHKEENARFIIYNKFKSILFNNLSTMCLRILLQMINGLNILRSQVTNLLLSLYRIQVLYITLKEIGHANRN